MMPVISALFTDYNNLQIGVLRMSLVKRLESQVYEWLCDLQGMSSFEAEQQARQIVREAKDISRNSGSYNFDYEWYCKIRDGSLKDEVWEEYLDLAIKEGVTEDDFRWWWSLPDLERHVMLKVVETGRIASYLKHTGNGLSKEEAIKAVRKMHPFYSSPKDENYPAGEDAPLPYELMDRINIFVQDMSINHPDEFEAKLQSYSSFNALIRSAIREGQLNRTSYIQKVELLGDFPFTNFKEYTEAYKSGKVDFNLDHVYAFQWAQGLAYTPRSVRVQTENLALLPLVAIIAILIYIFIMKSWLLLLALPLLIFGYIIFNPSFTQRMPFISLPATFLTFGALIWSIFGKQYDLLALSSALIIIFIAQKAIYINSVRKLKKCTLLNEAILCLLWEEDAITLRLKDP